MGLPVLKLTCKEGWKYIGWQRVFVEEVGGSDRTGIKELPYWVDYVAHKLNENCGPLESLRVSAERGSGLPACLFVLSGESYCFEDFADDVGRTLGVLTEIQDGEGE